MEISKGRSAFPGIAIGKIFYYSRGEYQLKYQTAKNIRTEINEFREAGQIVLASLTNPEAQDERVSDEKEAARMAELLQEESYRSAIEQMIEEQSVTASFAVQTTRDEMVAAFRRLEDGAARMRLKTVRELTSRLMVHLGKMGQKIRFGDENVILAAEDLLPAEFLEMDKSRLLGVVTYLGSEISHSAIMSKNLNIPALFDLRPDRSWNGKNAIVDGYTGTLYLDPDAEMLKEYTIRQKAEREEREELLKLRDKEDVTEDGTAVKIFANIGSMEDLESALYYGAAGIGLMRSEFQYLQKDTYPREEELFWEYRRVARTMGEKPAVIRTVDLGADKQAPYLEIPEETNPILGNRGIRLCLDRKQMFKAQIRAILRAAAYGNLSIMYPMISSLRELDEIEALEKEVRESLISRGIPFRDIRRGIMIETPAAVMMAEELSARVDFLGIGTNDLTQYTLAMDRQNPLLKNKYDDHHPAVLRMIRMVIEAGHRNACRVYICGEIAADTALTETFLRMGVDALSVVPACILPVRRVLRKTRLT